MRRAKGQESLWPSAGADRTTPGPSTRATPATVQASPSRNNVWFVLACGWPDPQLQVTGIPAFQSELAAQIALAEKQAEELPLSEGGATWSVLRVEIIVGRRA